MEVNKQKNIPPLGKDGENGIGLFFRLAAIVFMIDDISNHLNTT